MSKSDETGLTATACACGAITVFGDGWSNSMRPATFRREFKRGYPSLRVNRKDGFGSCDHCVNHWGIDLCGCGSGEPVGKCGGKFEECRRKIPAQGKGEKKETFGWRG